MSFILKAAGWLAETFLGSLVAKAAENAVEQFLAQSGERDLLYNLQKSLQTAKFFANKIESMRIKDEKSKKRLKELLLQLKDAAYDAHNLLDEFQYRSIQQQIEQQGYEASNPRSSSLSSSSSSFYSNFPPSKKIKTSVLSSAASRLLGNADDDDDDDVIRMKEIKGRLDKITTEIEEVTNFIDRDVDGRKLMVSLESRRTGAIPDETEVFGRDNELSALVELLLKSVDVSGYNNHDQNVSVLTIVGIGGVGKTTLAQQAYNDERVQEHFQTKAWVCVSENFTVERLTKEIIESSTTKNCDLVNFDALQLVLMQTIASRRFLLVLDDVWNEDKQKWESLCSPLRYGASGSMIVVTTRSTKIAEMVGNTDGIHLDGLDEESSWAFFKKCAFGSQNSGDYPQLEVIAKEIVPKLRGLPLVARTVGGLLNVELDVKRWKEIMESEIWKLPQDDDIGVLPVLQLSYPFLPAHLKQCFAFCSLFPNDYLFDERELIEIWMAEGFVSAQGNTRMEDVGSIYFHELLSMSFFQKSKYDDTKYSMHDLLHDLAQWISLGESYRIETGMSQEIPNTIRHISISNDNETDARILMEFPNRSKLRTLALLEDLSTTGSLLNNVIPCELIETLKNIRLLVLKYCRMKELPDSIGDLLHLRYFDITGNDEIRRLPDSLCDLCNMQTMILAGCYGIQSLPLGMSKLVNLRHIRTEYVKWASFLPNGMLRDEWLIAEIKGVGKLTSLQELPIFKVSREIGHKLVELSDLTQLHETLRIMNLENVESKEEASKAKLKWKQFLDELILEWSPIKGTNMKKNQLHISEEVLEGLQPHRNLRCLVIIEYKGEKCPSWLDGKALSKLEVVRLDICRRWEDISFIGQLSHLKCLHLKGMPMMKQVCNDVFGPTSTNCNFFYSLEELVLEELPLMEELPNLGHFPRLKILKIRGMLAVKKVGHGTDMGKCLPQLEVLEFSNMLALEEWTWTEGRELFPRLLSFEISDCPKLKRLPPVPPTLSELHLLRVGLTELPTLHEESNGTSRNTTASLHHLIISNCSNLRSLEQGLLSHHLPDLSTLKVHDCQELLWIRIRRLIGLGFLSIHDCSELTSINGFPVSLLGLEIRGCPKILLSEREEQGTVSSLRELTIDNVALLQQSPLKHALPSIEHLHIIESSQEMMFEGQEQELLPSLTALRCLAFSNCKNLQSLPTRLFTLPSLELLQMEGCPHIKSLPENGLPNSLTSLSFDRCHPELTKQLEKQVAEMKSSGRFRKSHCRLII